MSIYERVINSYSEQLLKGINTIIDRKSGKKTDIIKISKESLNSALNENFVKIKRSCCHYKNKIKFKETSELKESVFEVKNTRSKVYLFEGLKMNDQ